MSALDNRYSRAVVIAKLVLPLIALGILATLFFFSKPTQQGEPLRYSDETVQDLAREQRLGAPTYAGVTADGAELSLYAETLRPDAAQPEMVHGENMRATVLTTGGFGYRIDAKSGLIDQARDLTTLRDTVRITTSNGYEIRTEAVNISTDMTQLETPDGIEAEGPLGHITAGGMRVTGDPESGSGAVVVFKDGVRLLYQPKQ